MPVSFYEVIWIFLVYAFLGWCVEVAFAAVKLREFVNRGFLNGPACPIYGCGVLLLVVVLTPLKQSYILLFLGAFILASAIEFITGFLLEKLFHNKWWDYSERKFNICGYVCPLFSILWGLGCILVLKVIHPAIYKLIRIFPKLPGMIILVVFCIVFVVDLVITVASILKFNQRLALLDEVAGKIKNISNEIGENIYEGVTVAVEKGEELKENVDIRAAELRENIDNRTAEFKENIDNKTAGFKDALLEKKAERAKLQQEYNRLMAENVSFGMKRLMRAFPKMKSNAYQETLLKWKKYWGEKRKQGDNSMN